METIETVRIVVYWRPNVWLQVKRSKFCFLTGTLVVCTLIFYWFLFFCNLW